MAVLNRYLGELQTERSRLAEASLTSPEDKTEFGFGRAVGRLEGLRLAEEVLQRVLDNVEVEDRGTGRRGSEA